MSAPRATIDPTRLGSPVTVPSMGVRKDTRFVEITALVLGIFPCPESIALTPAARIPAAIAIFRTRCDLRSGGRGGNQRAAPAPEGALLPTIAGISSSKGKGFFLKNIFRTIVTMLQINTNVVLYPC
jgi:hypothetical protein